MYDKTYPAPRFRFGLVACVFVFLNFLRSFNFRPVAMNFDKPLGKVANFCHIHANTSLWCGYSGIV